MNRRELIVFGAAAAPAGAVGLTAGYRFHGPLQRIIREPETPRVSEFEVSARKIVERHRRQSKQDVQALKRKYEGEILAKFRVWELLQKLALCVHPTDTTLQCTSPYTHVCQIVAAMEQDAQLDDSMLLVALLHDLGKVALLANDASENVVCFTRPVEESEAGIGLDNLLLQFGHDEIAYQRLKDEVPDHVAWMIRYHSTIAGRVEPYLDARDRKYEDRYFSNFRRYDQGTKSPSALPNPAAPGALSRLCGDAISPADSVLGVLYRYFSSKNPPTNMASIPDA